MRSFQPRSFYEKTKKLFRETPAEIYVGVALGTLLFSGSSINHELKRERVLPISSAYIEAETPKEEFYARANNLSMNVFDAWNQSWERKGIGSNFDRLFARELEERLATASVGDESLGELLETVPELAQMTKEELSEMKDMYIGSSRVSNLLDKSWKKSRKDYEETEVYMDTTIDADGNVSSVTRTREVYSHSIHSYDYYPKIGKKASEELNRFAEDHNFFAWPGRIRSAEEKQLQEERQNERTKGKSFDFNVGNSGLPSGISVVEEDSEIQEFELKDWAQASTYEVNRVNILARNSEMPDLSQKVSKAKLTSKSDSYRKNSKRDSGPKEFQIFERAESATSSLESSLGKIFHGVNTSIVNPPQLDKAIEEYISANISTGTGDIKDLRKDIMKLSKDLYNANFEEGEDLSRNRPWMVILMALTGATLGGMSGALADYFGNRRNKFSR